MSQYDEQDGKRLAHLSRSELCLLLTARTNHLVNERGSGPNGDATYTEDIRRMVEVLNGLMLLSQVGDTIENIQINWRKR